MYYPALPVILMTAYDRRIAQGYKTDALAVFSKPLDLNRLLDRLRSLRPEGCLQSTGPPCTQTADK
jgi:hypothetical protein